MTSRRLLILAALAVGAACATEEKTPPAAAAASVPAPARTSSVHNDVRTLIGDAACQSDAQCATIGIGAKACGGPAAYVAWSSWRTDGEKLRAAAEQQAQAQRQNLAASGRVSNCMVETDPGAYCAFTQGNTVGVCRLRNRTVPGLPPVAR
jgi:hypothetical protein